MVDWVFPENMQPKQAHFSFDLQATFDAVVQVRATVPASAFTASILGIERIGNGVVIEPDKLVLTIGYLITEADNIWLTTNSGAVVPATVLAYDFATGFGLLMPLGPLGAPKLKLGDSSSAKINDDVILASHGGSAHASSTLISDKREFAGYWEYVLDQAIFTAPAHPQWGGAALVDHDGLLIGIGSLLVDDAASNQETQVNMIVPINLLTPILNDLVTTGRSPQQARPWLGMYTAESQGYFIVAGVAPGGPAEKAGVKQGDVVVYIAGEKPNSLANFFRAIWRHGAPGVDIPITLSRDGTALEVTIRSGDRNSFLYRPALH